MNQSPFKNQTDKLLYTNGGFNKCLGYENLSFDDTAQATLASIPDDAKYAVGVLIADATITDPTQKENIAWWSEDKNTDVEDTGAPSGEGMPAGHLTRIDLMSVLNMKNFKIIGIASGKTHSLRVQYY